MYKRIVLKVGASVLRKGNKVNLNKFREIAQDVSSLLKQGQEIVLVSSGAIASGMIRLNISKKPSHITELQAIASLGQIELMKLYQRYFDNFKVEIGQVLLTWDDFSDRKRYLNAQKTIAELLKFKIVPIINENDTLAAEEIKLGDNDRLSAMVSSLVAADLLLILSDVDGIYDLEGNLIPEVENIKETKKVCFGTDKEFSVGGMITKLEAAEICTALGIPCIISNGNAKNAVLKALRGNWGTYIKVQKKLKAKKHWLAYLSKAKGAIVIDAGAEEAVLKKSKSILPKGILKSKGNFEMGDLIVVLNKNNLEVARGITFYSATEVEKIRGRNSSEIISILGQKRAAEVINRDNLVLTGG